MSAPGAGLDAGTATAYGHLHPRPQVPSDVRYPHAPTGGGHSYRSRADGAHEHPDHERAALRSNYMGSPSSRCDEGLMSVAPSHLVADAQFTRHDLQDFAFSGRGANLGGVDND